MKGNFKTLGKFTMYHHVKDLQNVSLGGKAKMQKTRTVHRSLEKNTQVPPLSYKHWNAELRTKETWV